MRRGLWTPALTFDTPGDVAVTYDYAQGEYIRKNTEVVVWFSISTSTFTHTTAAGLLRITGIPFAVKNKANYYPIGSLAWTGITRANYTHATCFGSPGLTYLTISLNGSGQILSNCQAADMPTGGTVQLFGTLVYQI